MRQTNICCSIKCKEKSLGQIEPTYSSPRLVKTVCMTCQWFCESGDTFSGDLYASQPKLFAEVCLQEYIMQTWNLSFYCGDLDLHLGRGNGSIIPKIYTLAIVMGH